MIKNLKCTALLVGLFAVGATASHATQSDLKTFPDANIFNVKLIQDDGGSERINFSGKLRMLSQRIAASACNLHAGINPDTSRAQFIDASTEFKMILSALEFGDADLNINGAETRRKSLAALNTVKESWAPIDAVVNQITSDGANDASIQKLADLNNTLLDDANILVSELTGQYSNSVALVQADALRIDIAGRQRMLSQRISKDACMLLSGINAEASAASLSKAMSMFEVSLTALTVGMPAAGIKASTDADVVASLDIVAQHWIGIKPQLDIISADGSADFDARAMVFDALNELLVDMNSVVILYSNASKQDI